MLLLGLRRTSSDLARSFSDYWLAGDESLNLLLENIPGCCEFDPSWLHALALPLQISYRHNRESRLLESLLSARKVNISSKHMRNARPIDFGPFGNIFNGSAGLQKMVVSVLKSRR